ncbi:type II secretion system F family protein [Patescibacteria group bacterium]|nr:MAG: type II secretion system F family protein [Patescibacteria group bacterium]
MPKKKKELSSFEEKLNRWVASHLSRVPTMQKVLFVSHLKTMTKAGLSLIDSLKTLEQEIENKKLKKIVGEIACGVEAGKQLSEVLAEYSKVFPSIYVSMIAAGEKAGKLEHALEQVSLQMKKNHELIARVRGAMIYPAIIVLAMAGIATEVVVFILPKLMTMFKEMDAELPLATRALIGLTDAVARYGLWMALGLAAFIVLAAWAVKKPRVKKVVHTVNLKLPIAGKIIKKINLARFTMTMSSLLESTIPIIEAARITADVLGNVIYKRSLMDVSEALKKGETLSEILARYPDIFPPMVTEMITVGEKSGKTEEMLSELSDYYSNEVDVTMKNFTTIIEPAIILVLGLAVAGIAVAVIMPMYSLTQNI